MSLICSISGGILPASPSWRAFTKAFSAFLSQGSKDNNEIFPVPPNPVRLMPGGLASIVLDGFALLGSGKVAERRVKAEESEGKSWLKPISAEKLVYNI